MLHGWTLKKFLADVPEDISEIMKNSIKIFFKASLKNLQKQSERIPGAIPGKSL